MKTNTVHAVRDLCLICALGVAVCICGCKKNPPQPRQTTDEAQKQTPLPAPSSPPQPANTALAEAARLKVRSVREVLAAWYPLPADSLAKRRAGADELTAAHNRLPIGTLVRVTHLKNRKSVLVRITDRGITDKRIKIDVCKEAAEQLGMLSEGTAQVRLEILGEDTKAAAASVPDAAALRP